MTDAPLSSLPGIGKGREELFFKLGVESVAGLLCFLPISFRDNRVFLLTDTDPASPCMVRLTVQSAPRVSFFSGGKRAVRFTASDESGKADLIFFYQTYLASRFVVGETYYFYGCVKRGEKRFTLFSPEYEDGNTALGALTPIYRQTKGLSRRMIASAVAAALPKAEAFLPENLPPEVVRKANLPTRAEAAQWVHCPATEQQAARGRERFAFEELFFFRLDLLLLRKKRGIPVCQAMHAVSLAPFWKAVGFAPTEAQNRAVAEIFADLIGDGNQTRLPAMHRLLQGDVGSGKTAVAAAALYLTLRNGKKAALMAPTELLAEQHEKRLKALFAPFGFETLLLTGSTKRAERVKILARLSEPEPVLLIGTHALFTDDVVWEGLALTVVDEQHRFGVRARDALLQKAAEKNFLSMSATPIPRTLALFLFSPKDVSTLDALPPGRQKVETFYVGEQKRARVDAYITERLNRGERAYIVCPVIEESEESDLMAATTRFSESQATFSPYGVGFLHGKMSADKKRAALSDFASGKTRVLVSTTVIEIGIDVPEATVMCVEDADRFGLATLHQLRGRVGRGTEKSACILLSNASSKKSRERLKTMCEVSDGFRLSEYDMETRGPGDFFGVEQSGILRFAAARDADERLLADARARAEEFFEKSEKIVDKSAKI